MTHLAYLAPDSSLSRIEDFTFRGEHIPPLMVAALRRYLEFHLPPGGFLQSVLTNDLKGAVGSADPQNIDLLPLYVNFLTWHIPSHAWGSREKVLRWTQENLDLPFDWDVAPEVEK